MSGKYFGWLNFTLLDDRDVLVRADEIQAVEPMLVDQQPMSYLFLRGGRDIQVRESTHEVMRLWHGDEE